MLFVFWEANFPGDFPRWRHDRNYVKDWWRWNERCRRRSECEGKLGVSLESLRDKERWTFNEANAVRELHLGGWEGYRPTNENDDEFDRRLTDEMKNVAELNGLAEQWKWYDGQTQVLWGQQPKFVAVRNAIGRNNPQAMFRDLCYSYEPKVKHVSIRFEFPSFLENFTTYGYDSKLVNQEIKIAEKFVGKEGGWERVFMPLAMVSN